MDTMELIKKFEEGYNLVAQKQYDIALGVFTTILADPNCPKNLRMSVEKAINNLPQAQEVKIVEPVQIAEPEKKSIMKGNILQVDVFVLVPIPQIEDKMPISDADYERLKASIKKRGIQVPLIALPDFHLICGYNRWRAAKELGLKTVPVEFKEIPYTQLFEYAMKDNIDRRQLSQDQVLTFIEEVATQGVGRPKKNSRTKTTDEIAETLGVSERTVRRAKAKIRKIRETPALQGKSIKEVMDAEKADKATRRYEYIIGVNDEQMADDFVEIAENLFNFDINNGDKLTLVIQAYLKRG